MESTEEDDYVFRDQAEMAVCRSLETSVGGDGSGGPKWFARFAGTNAPAVLLFGRCSERNHIRLMHRFSTVILSNYSNPVSMGSIHRQTVVIFLKTNRDSEVIDRYVVPVIASEFPSREARSRLQTCLEVVGAFRHATIAFGRNNGELSQTHSNGSGMDIRGQ